VLLLGVNVPAFGSYNSALFRAVHAAADVHVSPPAISTCPLGNSVIVCPERLAVMLPALLKPPTLGS
jgi:hypothetical protein